MGNKYSGMTKETVLKAIKGSDGIMKRIAQRLKCESRTAKKLIDRWTETAEAYEDECNSCLDDCESLVYEDVRENRNVNTAKWILSRKGKSRGWNEDNTIKLANGDPLNITLGGEIMSKEEIEEAGNVEVPDYDDEE